MDFCKLNECEINYLVSALANALAEGLTKEEISFLSRFLAHLSGALQLIVSFKNLCGSQKNSTQINETQFNGFPTGASQASAAQNNNAQTSGSQTCDDDDD
ncbi:MAG TPA: hypothetical protein VIL03_06045 [Clostridia bacterium]|jgi:hypothetical protein